MCGSPLVALLPKAKLEAPSALRPTTSTFLRERVCSPKVTGIPAAISPARPHTERSKPFERHGNDRLCEAAKFRPETFPVGIAEVHSHSRRASSLSISFLPASTTEVSASPGELIIASAIGDLPRTLREAGSGRIVKSRGRKGA
jgi:hypothetical protein